MLLLIHDGCTIPRPQYHCSFSCIRAEVIRLCSTSLLHDVLHMTGETSNSPVCDWVVYTLPWKWNQKSTIAVFSLALVWTEIPVHVTWHIWRGRGKSGKDPYFCGIRDGVWISYVWMSKQNTLLLLDFRILPDRWTPAVCSFKLLGYVLSLFRPAWLIKPCWHW